MKTILLFRHAKSDWGDPGLADFDRPLAKRGLKDAPRMGEAVALFDYVPDRILSSPARRAKQTVELFADACGYDKSRIQWADSFYGGSSDDLITVLQQLPDRVERVMLVGHNPTMEETAAELLSARTAEGWDEEVDIRIPTAGLLCFETDIVSWADFEPGEATLRWYLIPKLVKALR